MERGTSVGPGGAALDERLVTYAKAARWAPSKHNTQPWRFVVGAGCLEVWADPSRLLPETDPQGRELLLSCGAAVETCLVVARGDGLLLDASVLPEGRGGPVARLAPADRRSPAPEDRALADQVPRRRTDRGPLDRSRLPVGLVFVLQDAAAARGAAVHPVEPPGDRAALARLVAEADRRLAQRSSVAREVDAWTRGGTDLRRDGVPAGNTRGARSSYAAEFVQRDFSREGTLPEQDQYGVDDPLVVVLATPHDGPQDWVAAGRALALVLLHTAAWGGAASYLNQVVEDPVARRQVREQLGLSDWPQLVLRLGVGGVVAAPPRRAVADVVFVEPDLR